MKTQTCALVVAVLLAANSSLADERVSVNQLPQPVQQVLADSGYRDAVRNVVRRVEDRGVVYDIAIQREGAENPRLVVAEDGTVISGLVARETMRAATTAGATETELRAVDTESMLALQELPSAVRATIEREAAGRAIADIDREMFTGRPVYEVEFRDPGLNSQIHVAEDGSLLRTSGPVRSAVQQLFAGTQLEDTPPAVQEVLRRELAGRQITDIDKERRSGRIVYEVEVEDARGEFELHVAEDGTIVRDERVIAE